MRRLSAFLIGSGLLLFVAAPARAATPDVTFTSPTPSQVVTTMDFTFQATARQHNGNLVGNIDVTIASTQGHGQNVFPSHATNNAEQATVTQNLTLIWNGAYETTLKVGGKRDILDNDTGQRTYTSAFTVDAPPATPATVTAAKDSKTRVVTVSWPANSEPDMVGYEVQKESPTGKWTAFAVTDRTTVTDESTATKGGTYRYQVRALRQSAQAGRLNPSPYSSPAVVTVPAPPAPSTTTTQPPTGGDPDDDDGGGGTTTTETNGGTGGGTEAGRGGGGTSGSSRRSSGPGLSPTGKVDLSDFSALLAQQGKQAAAGGAAPSEDDGTFEASLPFKSRTGTGAGAGADDEGEGEGEALGEEPASDGNGNPQALGFLAGGLLATVLAMHVMWVRSEVHRAEALEILTPVAVVEAPPATRRRRRPSPAAR